MRLMQIDRQLDQPHRAHSIHHRLKNSSSNNRNSSSSNNNNVHTKNYHVFNTAYGYIWFLVFVYQNVSIVSQRQKEKLCAGSFCLLGKYKQHFANRCCRLQSHWPSQTWKKLPLPIHHFMNPSNLTNSYAIWNSIYTRTRVILDRIMIEMCHSGTFIKFLWVCWHNF